MTYATFDIETTTRSRFKRKASPFGAGNWTVALGLRRKGDTKTHVHYFGKAPPGPGWLRQVLDGITLLGGFNMKFDLLHALQDPDNLNAWMDWIDAGGQIWDCQLAEYLLNGMGQKDHMLSLDEVAPRYGGSVKVDEVKALWAAGVDTHDIEPALLIRYLAGGNDEHGMWQHGDVENTELIMLGQIKRAREAGQLKSIMLNMGALVCSIEMERNGMFVDLPHALALAEALRAKIDEARVLLEGFLPLDLPFPFKWTSRFHKSALIFGGKVRYDRREYQLKDGTWTWTGPGLGREAQYAYSQREETHFVLVDGSTAECAWWEHVRDTEWQGAPPEGKDRVLFAGGKSKGEPKTKKVRVDDLTKPKTRMGEDWYTFPGFTTGDKRWATDTPGVFSVSDDVIEELGTRDIPFLKALSLLTSLTKDLGTYYITVDDEGNQKGMLSLVDEFGLIHHKINHTSTVTGRFSSSDPNLQNIPKGNKSAIKTAFVSRFGADGVLIQSDFSALEVYIQAILTGCEQLIKDLRAGLDMHVKRLALKEGISYEECYRLCKGGPGSEPVPEWDDKRTGAKVFSFQRAYGAGAAKIAASTGMPVDDVLALIAAEAEEYPEIDAYYEDLTALIKQGRRPLGRVIPHPDVPGVMCHLGESQYRTPDGKLYLYSEHPAPEFLIRNKHGGMRKDAVFASFSPTEIRNYVVQGEGGEWMKAAMWLSVRAFYASRNFAGRALLVNTVHDAAYCDSHQDVALVAAATLHACMEAASDFMEWYFKWDCPVPVPSDTTWGPSMKHENKIPGLASRAAEVRAELRARYMKGYVPTYLRTKEAA